MTSSIKIFSLNIGMNNSLAGLSSLIQSEKLDLILLQEVRMSSSQIESILPGFFASCNLDPDNPDRPGTAIVWHHTIPLQDVLSFSLCRLQLASLGPYRVINVYGPSGSNKQNERSYFYGYELFNMLQIFPQFPIICGGDYNCILEPIDVDSGFVRLQSEEMSKPGLSCKIFRFI